MDRNPFETDAIDESEAFESTEEGDAPFDAMAEGDAFDAMAGDMAEDLAGEESADALGESLFAEEGDAMALWDAFEEEVADGLDAADEDEFLGRILGGLGRAAGVLGRGLRAGAGVAGRVGGLARQGGAIAGQVGRVAGRISPAAQAAASLARMLGAPGVASGLQALGQGARTAQGWARTAQGVAGSLDQTATGAQGLLAQLSQLIGSGGDEIDDFDALADAFEDGVDEALPPMVALAARAAARGLGYRNLAQLTQGGRRALVRGIAAAARELVTRGGPAAARALPRLARTATRVATRRAPTPNQAVQAVRRGLPQTARRMAQSPRTLQRLAQPASRTPRPLARDASVGRGRRLEPLPGARTFLVDGPVQVTLTPR